MDTILLDGFTRQINALNERLAAETNPLVVQSLKARLQWITGKRDRLSQQWFGMSYDEAVSSGKYETWI